MADHIGRRTMLCWTVSGVVTATSGCAAIVSNRTGPETQRREIVVENDTDEAQSVTVRVTDESGRTVFEHRYTVAGGHLDESKSVGSQAELDTVTVLAPGLGRISRKYSSASRSADTDIVIRLLRAGPKIEFR